MRRSILIVMLDVMVLSVLALNSRHRAGGEANIPIPSKGFASVIEQGLRNEASYKSQIALLQQQLASSSDVANKALEQAALSEAKAERERAEAERERAEGAEALAKLRDAEFAAQRAEANATLASREADLVNQQAEAAQKRAAELEQREREAKARADAANARVMLAEQKANEAERLAREAEKVAQETAGEHSSQILALKEEALRARTEKESAEKRASELAVSLANREAALNAAKTAEATAVAKAEVAVNERERLEVKAAAVGEDLITARESVATLKEREKSDSEKLAQLNSEKAAAAAEREKSIWVLRDEAMRRVVVRYTEHASNGSVFIVDKELAMPLVKVGRFNVVPIEYKALGLKKTIFGGLSDRVTDVYGVAAPMVGEAKPGSLNAIIVPAAEPQVCLAHVTQGTEGALKPLTMLEIKARRTRTAMLFSSKDENNHGLVEVIPMLGKDYLTVRSTSGTKPRVGDYLLTERGDFIGIMVKSDVCYVLPAELSATPKPVVIPLRTSGKKEVYLSDFVRKLNQARASYKRAQSARGF